MALLGIVDYSTSSSSDSDTEEEEEILDAKELQGNSAEDTKGRLPAPNLERTGDVPSREMDSESIFHNPYLKEKELNISKLSRHVLPSENKDAKKQTDKTEIKICRKFAAKGQCRFGDKCKFVHTQDQQDNTKPRMQGSNKRNGNKRHRPRLIGDLDGLFDEDDDEEREGSQRRRKRPGLTNSIIPSKKVVAMYNMFSK